MPSGLMSLSFHAADAGDQDVPRQLTPLPPAAAAMFGPPIDLFADDESAARFYLAQELGLDNRPAMQAFMGAEAFAPPGMAPSLIPALEHTGTHAEPLTNTRVVQFDQRQAGIPVFGSHVVVEITPDRAFLSLDAELADPLALAQVAPTPALSPTQALQQLAAHCGVATDALAAVAPPSLALFYAEATDTWHLAYFFEEVPAAPPAFLQEAAAGGLHHGPDLSPRELFPSVNYLLDAHTGTLLYFYSAQPLIDTPTLCLGIDGDGGLQEFYGLQVPAGFELNDPLRKLVTYDFELREIGTVPPPAQAVAGPEADFAAANPAAISAHTNAMRVYDFYKSVLMRDGVDDNGMVLVSIVNCYVRSPGTPYPVWRNATWWQDRMWYGQEPDPNGGLRSTARYLDVIAHELTHGVTQYTSNLVYRDQSGALNESFSDIFGVIVANWHRHGADGDVAAWSWEIAPGWRPNGLPLRDLRNPRRLGAPEHMRDYLVTAEDSGGVHTNSSIHNKAAYNVLTAVDAKGARVFRPRDVAVLYYVTLTQLPPTATFAKVREVLENKAKTIFARDPALQLEKVAAIRKAYAAVGIQ
ncbi:MAG: M4 family metallopeptidase [Caldilineaceae bacterium]